MLVTVIARVIGSLGTLFKGFVKGQKDLEIRGNVETIKMTALLWSARLLRSVLETWGDLLQLKLQWKTISRCWKRLRNNNDNNNVEIEMKRVIQS